MICPKCGEEAISVFKILNITLYSAVPCKNCETFLRPDKNGIYQFVHLVSIVFNSFLAVFLSNYFSNGNQNLRSMLLLIMLPLFYSLTYYILWKKWKLVEVPGINDYAPDLIDEQEPEDNQDREPLDK